MDDVLLFCFICICCQITKPVDASAKYFIINKHQKHRNVQYTGIVLIRMRVNHNWYARTDRNCNSFNSILHYFFVLTCLSRQHWIKSIVTIHLDLNSSIFTLPNLLLYCSATKKPSPHLATNPDKSLKKSSHLNCLCWLTDVSLIIVGNLFQHWSWSWGEQWWRAEAMQLQRAVVTKCWSLLPPCCFPC